MEEPDLAKLDQEVASARKYFQDIIDNVKPAREQEHIDAVLFAQISASLFDEKDENYVRALLGCAIEFITRPDENLPEL